MEGGKEGDDGRDIEKEEEIYKRVDGEGHARRVDQGVKDPWKKETLMEVGRGV